MFIRKKHLEELKKQYQADIRFFEKRLDCCERLISGFDDRVNSLWQELNAATFCRQYPSGYALFFGKNPSAVYINWRAIENVCEGKICYLVYARLDDVNFVCVCKLPKEEGYFLHSAKVIKETRTVFLIEVAIRRRFVPSAYGAGEMIDETYRRFRVYKRTGDVEEITGKEIDKEDM